MFKHLFNLEYALFQLFDVSETRAAFNMVNAFRHVFLKLIQTSLR